MQTETVFAGLAAIAAIVAAFAAIQQSKALRQQIELQRKDLQYSAYERLMSTFTETTKFFFAHPEIEKYIPYTDFRLRRSKRAAFFYLDMLLAFLERAWTARDEDIMWPESWSYWAKWIGDLSESEVFVEHFNLNKKYYARKFVEEVQSIIDGRKRQTRS